MSQCRAGLVLVCCLLGTATLAGCASTPHYSIDTSPESPDGSLPTRADDDRGRSAERASDSRQRPEDTKDGDAVEVVVKGEKREKVRQSNDDNNDWGDAFMAPLEDFNLRKQDIPEILLNAVEKPYDLTGMDTCEAIASQVTELDRLLGSDFDEPPPPKDQRTNTEKGKEFANKQAIGAVRNTTRGIVPFRGYIRYLSGADKHQKAMDNAIQAGKVRRAYLKGMGMNKNCAPPAAPSWFEPRVYVETYVQPEKPAAGAKKPAPKKRTSKKHR